MRPALTWPAQRGTELFGKMSRLPRTSAASGRSHSENSSGGRRLAGSCRRLGVAARAGRARRHARTWGVVVSRSRKPRVIDASLAFASDGSILVNALQLGSGMTLNEIIGYAKASGLPIFIGVVVPPRLRERFVREFDDATADVVGRLGPRLSPDASRASASSPSSGAPASARPDRPQGPAPRPPGRRRGP